jgi:hypothetical protein
VVNFRNALPALAAAKQAEMPCFQPFGSRSRASRSLARAMQYKNASDGDKIQRGESTMSIQKKSLISTLKSAKKANVVKEEVTASPATASARISVARKAPRQTVARKAPRQTVARKAPRQMNARKAPRMQF